MMKNLINIASTAISLRNTLVLTFFKAKSTKIFIAFSFLSYFSYNAHCQSITPYEYIKGETAYRAKSLIGIDIGSARILSDSIVEITRNKYISPKEMETDSLLTITYSKDGKGDSSTNLIIVFEKNFEDEISDNNNKKVLHYHLRAIEHAPIVDILPFWKAYIDPDLDISKIPKNLKNGYIGPSVQVGEVTRNGKTSTYNCYLVKYGKKWYCKISIVSIRESDVPFWYNQKK